MIRKVCRYMLVLCAGIFLFACGGGGGSGGSSGSGSRTGLRVLNAAIDLAPLRAISSILETNLPETSSFAAASLRMKLADGPQMISISEVQFPATTLTSKMFTAEDKGKYTLLVVGDTSDAGIQSTLLSDDAGDIPAGSVALRVLHAAVGSPEISVKLSGASNAALQSGFAGSAMYNLLPVGTYQAKILGSDGSTIGRSTLVLEDRQQYSLLVAGKAGLFVSARLLND